MYDTITAAVCGTGFIGPVHIEALKRLGVSVKGVMGSSPEKSEVTRSAMGLEVTYDHFDQILEDDDIDSVHLAVPNVLHYSMAKKALQAGKHVMCEKPLAMTSTESQELVELAKSTGLAAGVTYNVRFYPINLEAASQVRSGSIGRIFSVTGSYVQDWLMYDTDYNWRVLASKGGVLRAVADIGTHWMDLISNITGQQITQVFADLSIVHPVRHRPLGEVATFTGKDHKEIEREEVNIETEDCGAILFRLSDGAQGVLWVSQITAGRKNSIQYEIAGSGKSLSWDSERPNELRIGYRNEPNQTLFKDPGLVSEGVVPYINYPGGHHEGFPDTFKQCFRAFYNAILQKLDSSDVEYPTFLQGHKEILLCEAILTSHENKQWVSLE